MRRVASPSQSAVMALAMIMLSGCGQQFAFEKIESNLIERRTSAGAHSSAVVKKEIALFGAELKRQKPNRLNSEYVTKGLLAMANGDYISANRNLERALKYEPQNAFLHALNGLAHQMRGEAGDPENYQLAEVAYQLAARMDPGDAWVPYQAGIMHFKQQKYLQAQEQFAKAVALDPNRPEHLIGLAAASYYLGDLDIAYTNVEKALSLSPNSPAALQTGGMIHASLGAFDKARMNADRLGGISSVRQRYLSRRISEWKSYYGRNDIKQTSKDWPRLAQSLGVFGVPNTGLFDPTDDSDQDPLARGDADASTQPPDEDAGPSTDSAVTAATTTPTAKPSVPGPAAPVKSVTQATSAPAVPAAPKVPVKAAVLKKTGKTVKPAKAAAKKPKIPSMALIDVAIIRSEEIFRSSKGVNLLNGLNIFFSTSPFFLTKTPFGIGRIRTPVTTNDTISLQFGTAGAGLTYSLNIFSNTYDRNEVIARPTILVEDQKKSTFFSGGTLHIVLEGGVAGSGSLQPINTGVKLEVTPKFLDADTIDMSVFAQRTYLEAGLSQVSDRITGTTFAQTSKTTIAANLTLRYGETMVLSGLSDQEKEVVDDKTPGVGDLPVLQYFFRDQTKLSSKKTVLVLLTPRRASLRHGNGDVIEAKDSSDNSAVGKLKRTSKWMQPAPHLSGFVKHLGRYDFFNHYRKGDMQLERWAGEENIGQALLRTLEYLYIYYEFEKNVKSEL